MKIIKSDPQERIVVVAAEIYDEKWGEIMTAALNAAESVNQHFKLVPDFFPQSTADQRADKRGE